MRRLMALLALCVAGCGTDSSQDMAAAQAYIRNMYSNVETTIVAVEEPEYATVSKIPKKGATAACGVRVRFKWRDENRTTHDDWIVWVTSDHQAVAWSSIADGNNWRQYVRSCAKK
jgi:hypothetical protein